MQTRRLFLKRSALTTGIFALGFQGTGISRTLVAQLVENAEAAALNQFIAIGSDNSITLYNHRPEMGQGTFTSIPMILAEELDVEMSAVTIKQSKADSSLYGGQMVVGSHSIHSEFEKLRLMGASARHMLCMAAANKWNVSPDSCSTDRGMVIHDSGKHLSYGALALDAAQLTPPENVSLKDPSEFKIIGTEVQRRDIPLKTNGSAVFGMDTSVNGMLYASVERSPVFLGTVESFNESDVLAMPGVRHVFKTSRNVYGNKREGVAVLADTYWAALNGRKKLTITWNEKNLRSVDGEKIRENYVKQSTAPGTSLFSRGKVDNIPDGKTLEATYETPYQAHVPMEPMNAIVSISSDKAEFWGSTQNPNGIRSYLSEEYSIPAENVQINYTFMGGGFGRRSMLDVVEEAADLSKKSGVPVKVVWTREDDLTQGPFRACSLNHLKGVITDNGKVQMLEHRVVAQEIRNQTGDDMTAGRMLMGGINTDYTIPDFSVIGILQKSHVPISYWRAVYHSTNPFAHESFIDELAHAAGADPIEFRLGMLEHPRYRRVLTEVRKVSGWDKKKEGIGRGVATVERSGAYFAMVVEVQRKNNKVVPTRIVTALDLGICVNPDTVRAQTEGSITMGLGAVYYGLNLESGGIRESNFNDYPLLRIDQIPEIETYILPGTAQPDGAGESGLPTVAPALVNAIFDLTGERIRKLPLEEKYIP